MKRGHRSPSRRRPGFSFVEVVVTMGILGIITSVTIIAPLRFMAISSLNNATAQTAQMLSRAKALSEAGEHDSSWGVYVPAGILFRGSSMITRDPAFDQITPMPPAVATSGLTEVSFSQLRGIPNRIGTILLTNIYGDKRSVAIDIDALGTVTIQTDVFTICHNPGELEQENIDVTDSDWPAHRSHGDSVGPCIGPTAQGSSSSGSSSSGASEVIVPTSCPALLFFLRQENFGGATSAHEQVTVPGPCSTGIQVLVPSSGCTVNGNDIDCPALVPSADNTFDLGFTVNRDSGCSFPSHEEMQNVVKITFAGASQSAYNVELNRIVDGACVPLDYTIDFLEPPSQGGSSSSSSAYVSDERQCRTEGAQAVVVDTCDSAAGSGLCNQPFYEDITFATAFPEPPSVLVTPQRVSVTERAACVAGATDKVVCYPQNITTTGFRLVCAGSPPAANCGAALMDKYGPADANWIAMQAGSCGAQEGHNIVPSVCSDTLAANGVCRSPFTQNVTFATPFATVPNVLSAPENISTQTGCVGEVTDRIRCTVTSNSVTTTGFNLECSGSPVGTSCTNTNRNWFSQAAGGWIARENTAQCMVQSEHALQTTTCATAQSNGTCTAYNGQVGFTRQVTFATAFAAIPKVIVSPEDVTSAHSNCAGRNTDSLRCEATNITRTGFRAVCWGSPVANDCGSSVGGFTTSARFGYMAMDASCSAGQCLASSRYLTGYTAVTRGTMYNGSTTFPATSGQASNVLGQPPTGTFSSSSTSDFFALGYGGRMVVSFAQAVTNGPGADVRFFEASPTNAVLERARVSARADSGQSWTVLGTIDNTDNCNCKMNSTDLDLGSLTSAQEFLIEDTTPRNAGSTEGFDLSGALALNCESASSGSSGGDLSCGGRTLPSAQMVDGHVVVCGTGGADTIAVTANSPSTVRATVNGQSLGIFGPFSEGHRVVIWGLDGNDNIRDTHGNSIPLNTEIYGGVGDDVLVGTDYWHNVLWGGVGNDSLSGVGTAGALIGGTGQDTLSCSGALGTKPLCIGGEFATGLVHDGEEPYDFDVLQTILGDWEIEIVDSDLSGPGDDVVDTETDTITSVRTGPVWYITSPSDVTADYNAGKGDRKDSL